MHRLMHVAEFRVSITKILDLLGTDAVEAVVALAQTALPVLPFTVCNAKARQDPHANLAAKVDRVAGGIPRLCVIRDICPLRMSADV